MRNVARTLAVVCASAALVATTAAAAFAVGIPVENAGVSPEVFEQASFCGCHSAFVEQWSKTMHAQALTDPLYLAKLEEANAATDGKLNTFCKRCHGPAAMMTGELDKGGELSAGPAQGVVCSFCHQISGMTKQTPGNVSQLVDPSGVRRAQLKDPQAPHAAAYSELHEKAEICGGCHNVNHPVNGMHLESTYTEWKESPYAAEGIVCQDCHMTRQPGERGPSTGQAAGGAPQRDNIYQMIFVGGQVELGPSDIATARLQSAAEIKLEIPEIVEPGASAQAKVTITNSGAGHYLPTGLTEVRQMWLEVTATDSAGKQVKVGEHIFGTILQDEKGNAPVELWEAADFKSDDRIPPRESVTDEFSFTMPPGMENAKLKAALLYKSAPDELAKKAGVKNPTTEMAVAEKTVYASAEAREDAALGDAESATEGQGRNKAMSTWWVIIDALVIVIIGAGIVYWVRSRRAS